MKGQVPQEHEKRRKKNEKEMNEKEKEEGRE